MQGFLRKVGERALSDSWTVTATYWQTRMVIDHGTPGDLVECGVFAGVQVAAMARACQDAGETGRRIHLFDSFAGIPKAGPNDNDMRELLGSQDGEKIESSGISVCGIEDVRVHMKGWGIPESMLVYHSGWFHETLPVHQIEKIALLRLDGDLYDSTKICLEHLYPLLSQGGVCIIDDFNLDGCRRAVQKVVGALPAPLYWLKT